MTSLTQPIRAWRVLYRMESMYCPQGDLRRTIYAECAADALTLAQVNLAVHVRGYDSRDVSPTILAVKPFVRL